MLALLQGWASSSLAATDEIRLSKAEQHRAGIRTLQISAMSQELQGVGQIVADPRYRRLLAAPESGMIVAPETGFPVPGTQIGEGQLLGYLLPAIPLPERRGLEAELALTRRDVRDGRLKAERFNADEAEDIDINLPTPSIQILSEYRGARAREQALAASLQERIPLFADSAGVLLRAAVRQSGLVARGESLFEWVPPDRYAVAIRIPESAGPAATRVEARTADGQWIVLEQFSEGRDQKTGTRVAWFAVAPSSVAAPATLLEAEPVRLRPLSSSAPVGLPAAALQSYEGEQGVWTHVAPEKFVRRPVDAQMLGDGTARVSGLGGDVRVVVAGSAFLQHASAPSR